jgi:DNA-binding transcriptional ArsR family regulator
VHLLPTGTDRPHVLDAERVCDAIAALGDDVEASAARFAVLGDPGRLRLLLAIRAAAPISVTDLAAATGMREATVSQALRQLRLAGAVRAERDGRAMRYALDDEALAALLPAAPS